MSNTKSAWKFIIVVTDEKIYIGYLTNDLKLETPNLLVLQSSQELVYRGDTGFYSWLQIANEGFKNPEKTWFSVPCSGFHLIREWNEIILCSKKAVESFKKVTIKS